MKTIDRLPVSSDVESLGSCVERGCAHVTRGGKAYCPDHITSQPYARWITERLAAWADELERVDQHGPVAVDLGGAIAGELMRLLAVGGPRTIERLALDLQVSRATTETYVSALNCGGRVKTWVGQRGATLVRAVPAGDAEV